MDEWLKIRLLWSDSRPLCQILAYSKTNYVQNKIFLYFYIPKIASFSAHKMLENVKCRECLYGQKMLKNVGKLLEIFDCQSCQQGLCIPGRGQWLVFVDFLRNVFLHCWIWHWLTWTSKNKYSACQTVRRLSRASPEVCRFIDEVGNGLKSWYVIGKTHFRIGLIQFQKLRGSCFTILWIKEYLHIQFSLRFRGISLKVRLCCHITIINVDFAQIPLNKDEQTNDRRDDSYPQSPNFRCNLFSRISRFSLFFYISWEYLRLFY